MLPGRREEAAALLVVVARPLEVDAQIGIELLTGIQIVVWRTAEAKNEIAESVVIVSIGYGSVAVRQHPDRRPSKLERAAR